MNTTEAEFLEEIREDFVSFARALWADRGLDEKAPLSEIELDILRWVSRGPFNPTAIAEAEVTGVPIENKRGVLAFRSIGKTHMTATYTLWLLLRDPDHKIKILSKTEKAAIDAVKLIRAWISSVWFLRHLEPRPARRTGTGRMKQDDAAKQFLVGPAQEAHAPSVAAFGINGQITGTRAHTIIPDDVETPENTRTVTAREDLARIVTEFDAMLYPTGEIVYNGTIHHIESLYLKLPKRGYVFRTWPLVFPRPNDVILNLSPMLRRMLDTGEARPDDLVCPHRFNENYRAQQEAVGATYFSMQFRLLADLGSRNLYPISLSDLIVFEMAIDRAPVSATWGMMDHNGSTALEIECSGFHGDRFHRPIAVDQTVTRYIGTKAFLDPAGKGEDETALAIVSSLGAILWTQFVGGWHGGPSDSNLNAIAETCRRFHVTELAYEKNIDIFGTYAQLLTLALRRHFLEPGQDPEHPDGWKCSLTPVQSGGSLSKVDRIIDTLEPVISTHRLVIHPRAIRLNTDLQADPAFNLQNQLAYIRRQKGCLDHDDRVDALAGAVRLWKDTMSQDPAKAAARHKGRKSLDQLIEEAHRINRRRHEYSWFNTN